MLRIELLPGGKIIDAPASAPLRDILFRKGVEFPCGGLGRCRRCKVRLLKGRWAPSPSDYCLLSADELHNGWRLSCQGVAQDDLTLEVAQWDSPILADETPFEFTPGEGLGVAIDLGTTTIAAQLLDLENANILGVTTSLNSQGAHGADVMTRLDFALSGGGEQLTRLIRSQINDIIKGLVAKSDRPISDVRSIILVGNTAMHHLFCGLPLEQLARDPFEQYSRCPGAFMSGQLGWDHSDLHVSFLPPIGGFVGSDILAGVVATRLHEHHKCVALMDLGTNGELVVANAGKILCASTAAGPAFEGARIITGMRAATGAIHAVHRSGDAIRCEVLGGGKPRGICGSGLVDAIATGLDCQIIKPNGRFANGAPTWHLLDPIALHQKDIRELQLAKGAIAAGLMILLHETRATLENLDQIFLAGAFGNYINRQSAARIGLIPVVENVIQPGNTALLGAKLALFPEYRAEFDLLQSRINHVPLNERSDFQELFLQHIQFPETDRIHAPQKHACAT